MNWTKLIAVNMTDLDGEKRNSSASEKTFLSQFRIQKFCLQ